MHVLAVCESAPTLDVQSGNGSTLITAQVLPRLPDDMILDLVYYSDSHIGPDPAVTQRCRSVKRLPLRPQWAALAAMPVTRLPRATWQRAGKANDEVAKQARTQADVTYFHGLHTFAPVATWPTNVVVNEVDPWSTYWMDRARERKGAAARYDRLQARRAARLEQRVADRASAFIVVSEADASVLRVSTGRDITALPNGLDLAHLQPRSPGESRSDTLVFVGTLDYSPNVQALKVLCAEVWPLVRAAVPQARLVIAGRRAGPEVKALIGPGIELIGQVDSVRSVFAEATAAVYPGDEGQGLKNTLRESLAVGCPVIASPVAARGLPPGPHVAIAGDPHGLATCAIRLLTDESHRAAADQAASDYALSLESWDVVAQRYAELLRTAAASEPA